jgi:hypothetical protein
MTQDELKEFLVALTPPEGMQKPNLDGVLDPAIEAAFEKVWVAHWWNFRMSRTELTTVASQPFVSCPDNFEQGIHLGREGSTGKKIEVVSPSQFYDDHPYPEGDPTGLPSQATLLYNETWDDAIEVEKFYRLYLWPIAAEAHTLPLIYLIGSSIGDLGNMPGYFVSAVIAEAKALIGYMSHADAESLLEMAREKAGGFIFPPGRHKLAEVKDLNDFGGRGRQHNPQHGYY